MWIATENGFYSIVKNNFSDEKENELIVRARKKEDLANVFDAARIETSTQKDYAYRVFASRKEVEALLVATIHNLDYGNFKDHIKSLPSQKDKVPFYSEIWSIMNEYQGQFIKGLYNFTRK
ncbi:hypothetical protein [Lunatimonas salinarum]|uniref:hypothetical protein n=1 Tax=Lunatimonas salinarum TaxID=1774590 RepID=UPI001ADF8F8F|nr:hypothetical protein [Lunatimonas salinarum]